MTSSALRRTALVLTFLAASPAVAEMPPLPDYAIPGPWQDHATASGVFDSFQAVPAFREPAPDHPVPMGEDIRWCHHITAAKELQFACMAHALDPALCDQAFKDLKADRDWINAIDDLHKYTISNAERGCRR
jgi:hypothetical protein